MSSLAPVLFRSPTWLRAQLQPAAAEVKDVTAATLTGSVQTSRPPPAIRWTLAALFIGMVFTDRFGIAIGGFPLGASMPLAYVLLFAVMCSGRLALDVAALVVYAAIVAVASASYLINANIAGGNGTSINSMLLLLALYLPFVFGITASNDNRAQWLWMMQLASVLLLTLAVCGICQYFVQFVFRAPWLFDFSKLIPEPIRAQGLYNSAIPNGSGFKSNGFFSREPSNFSFWMALGLIVELSLFKRVQRIACFALALLLSYSGTGLLALAIGLLFPFRPKFLAGIGLVAAVIFGADAAAGDPLHLAFTLGRFGEFGAQGSSAYARYVAPLQLVDANFTSTPWSVVFGHGPGTIQRNAAAIDSHDPTWAKLLFEYGIAGFVLCLGFVGYKLSRFPAPFQFRAVLFANWLVMGGYLLTPESVYTGFILLAFWPAPPRPGGNGLQRGAPT